MTTTTDLKTAPSPLLVPTPYRVLDKVDEGSDIVTLRVVPVESSLPDFEPAQVSMLGSFGVGEAAISISSARTMTDHHAYTIRRAGAITNALIDTPIGGVITVRGPFGNHWPLDTLDTDQLLIAAGGLGIAPLRAAIDQAVGEPGLDRLAVIYGAKTPSDLIYRDDLTAWADSGAEMVVTVDVGADAWSGPVGVVPAMLGVEGGVDLDWSKTTAFVCGPDVMMHFTALKLIDLGVPAERIWLTLERNMQCGNALCGHCQLGPFIVCRDGPIASYAEIQSFHPIREL